MTDIYWANAGGGDFADAADWQGGAVPESTEYAVLGTLGAPYVVTSSENQTVLGMHISNQATLSISGETFKADTSHEGFRGAVNNDGAILVNGGTFGADGTLDNTGNVRVGGEGPPATFETTIYGLTLSGGGRVTFDAGSTLDLVYAAGLFNADNTIIGSINVTGVDPQFDNNGIVDCTGSSSIPANMLTNSGVIETSGSGDLRLHSGNEMQNAGGVIRAGGTGITLYETAIAGGSLETAGSGTFDIYQVDLDGLNSTLTNGAVLNLVAQGGKQADFVGILGSFDNSGAIVESASAGLTYVYIGDRYIAGAGATLSGHGDITLSDEARNYLSAWDSGAVLTNLNNTISGAGVIGEGALGIDNEAAGVIDATGTNALVLETGASTIDNKGLIEATGKGGLAIKATTVNDADGGTISAGTGSKVTLAGADVEVGTLGTAGTGQIKVTGAGNTIAGETSGIEIAGEMVVLTGASLTGTGVVVLNDELVAKGDATLGGALINNGTLEVAGGSITVSGAVSGTGEAVIDGGTLSFGAAFSQKAVFDGGGELILADSPAYAGTVWKFSTSGATSLDLQNIAFAGATATYSGTAGQGVLTVTSGSDVAHITFKGDYLGTTFTLGEDASGGTIVTDMAAAPAVARITQAIAGFASSAPTSLTVTHGAGQGTAPTLTGPGLTAA